MSRAAVAAVLAREDLACGERLVGLSSRSGRWVGAGRVLWLRVAGVGPWRDGAINVESLDAVLGYSHISWAGAAAAGGVGGARRRGRPGQGSVDRAGVRGCGDRGPHVSAGSAGAARVRRVGVVSGVLGLVAHRREPDSLMQRRVDPCPSAIVRVAGRRRPRGRDRGAYLVERRPGEAGGEVEVASLPPEVSAVFADAGDPTVEILVASSRLRNGSWSASAETPKGRNHARRRSANCPPVRGNGPRTQNQPPRMTSNTPHTQEAPNYQGF